MVSKQKHFRFETIMLSFRKHFHFCLGNTFILQKKVNQKQIENKLHQLLWSWPHACHPSLRASVSTWECLICRFSFVDVWLQ